MHILKTTELYTLNGLIIRYVSYISIKLLLETQNRTVNQAKMPQDLTRTTGMELERPLRWEGKGRPLGAEAEAPIA